MPRLPNSDTLWQPPFENPYRATDCVIIRPTARPVIRKWDDPLRLLLCPFCGAVFAALTSVVVCLPLILPEWWDSSGQGMPFLVPRPLEMIVGLILMEIVPGLGGLFWGFCTGVLVMPMMLVVRRKTHLDMILATAATAVLAGLISCASPTTLPREVYWTIFLYFALTCGVAAGSITWFLGRSPGRRANSARVGSQVSRDSVGTIPGRPKGIDRERILRKLLVRVLHPVAGRTAR